jgi:GT2 family glycosyltransferase
MNSPAATPGTRNLICVFPSRTDEYADSLLQSMKDLDAESTRHCIVVDTGGPHGALSGALRKRWSPVVTFLMLDLPFVFAKAANLGIKAATERCPDCDVLLLNDDIDMKTPLWWTRLRQVLASQEAKVFGVLSLVIEPTTQSTKQIQYDTVPAIKEIAEPNVALMAAVLRREAITSVGNMDERYVGYGYDDVDYCRTLRLAGYKLGVTNGIVAKHGKGGYGASSTFRRATDHATWQSMIEQNRLLYEAKWGSVEPEESAS